MNKLVSVIITTYARPDNLIRAINSVKSQTYSPIEIIVVDDNGLGTDCQKETKSLLKDLIESNQIIYIPHEVNKNGSVARNTGLLVSKGDFINFMDDDDTFEVTKIEKQVEVLNNNPEHGACYCNIFMKGGRKGEYCLFNNKEGNLTSFLLLGKVRFNTTTVLFRRSVIESLGGFDESFLRHQDWEIFIRFFRSYTMGIVYGEPLISKYRTPNAVSRNPYRVIEYKEKFLRTFKKDIDNLSDSALIYKYQYLQLGHSLIGSKYRKEGLRYVLLANKSNHLHISEWYIIARSYIFSFFSR